MKKVIIGIASQQAIRTRALAIASGDHQPRSDEPKSNPVIRAVGIATINDCGLILVRNDDVHCPAIG